MSNGDGEKVITNPPVNTSTSTNVPTADTNPQPEQTPENPNLLVKPPRRNPMRDLQKMDEEKFKADV